jgi:hypothetical protein
MFKKLALIFVVAAATGSNASAHLFGHHHFHSYGYAVPAYGYVAPVAYYPAPVFPVPDYPSPVYQVPVVQPVYGYWPTTTTILYRANQRRSVLRVRSW